MSRSSVADPNSRTSRTTRERKLVTVLFADVAGFTSLSDKLDPEEVHQIMDGCFQILLREIHGHEGTINQFTGDGVMALFGAPVAHEDHAQRACHAALAIQKALAPYGEKVQRECGVAFRMRIGLNSGPVVVGSIGDDLRMDYTAVGDTTNLAARMQSLARPGGILASANAHRLVRDYFVFKPLGKLTIKGKKEPQEAYELVKPGGAESRIEASQARGLTPFVGRRRELETLCELWEKARSGAGQIAAVVGEAGVGKSRLLLEMRRTLEKGDATYLEGRCLHFGSSMPYLPILDILRTYFGIEEKDGAHVRKEKISDNVLALRRDLSHVIAPCQDLFSLPLDDPRFADLEPQRKRDRVFEAVRDILGSASRHRPLLLAVEDLQWIDKTSQEFLDYLIGWLAPTRILLTLV